MSRQIVLKAIAQSCCQVENLIFLRLFQPANKIHIFVDSDSSPMAKPSNTAWKESANTAKKSRSKTFLPSAALKLSSSSSSIVDSSWSINDSWDELTMESNKEDSFANTKNLFCSIAVMKYRIRHFLNTRNGL